MRGSFISFPKILKDNIIIFNLLSNNAKYPFISKQQFHSKGVYIYFIFVVTARSRTDYMTQHSGGISAPALPPPIPGRPANAPPAPSGAKAFMISSGGFPHSCIFTRTKKKGDLESNQSLVKSNTRRCTFLSQRLTFCMSSVTFRFWAFSS
jgi:hypothetical protein